MVQRLLPAALVPAFVVLLVTPCAQAGSDWNARVADSANWFLQARPRLKKNDCGGLVCAVLERAGATERGNSRTMWRDAVRDGRVTDRPHPGDLVFFDHTYDRNRNGRVDDPLSHVGVVSAIEANGTLVVVHKSSRGITTLRLTTSAPAVHRRGGRVLNDYLRQPGYGPANGRRLAGQLVHGFARPPRPETRRTAAIPRKPVHAVAPTKMPVRPPPVPLHAAQAIDPRKYERWLDTDARPSRFD